MKPRSPFHNLLLAACRVCSIAVLPLLLPGWGSAQQPHVPAAPRSLTTALGPAEAHWLIEPFSDTYRESIRRAILRHPSLKAAVRRLNLAEAASRQSAAVLLPQAALSGQVQHQETSKASLTTDADLRSAGIVATQTLLDLSAWQAWRREAANAAAARQTFAADYQAFLLQVTSAYLAALEARETAALSRANYDLANHHLEATQQRQAAGELTRTDADQARARAAGAEAEWLMSQAAAEAADLALAELVGEVPAVPSALPTFGEVDASLAAVAGAVERCPQLQAAAARARAADRQVEAVWSQALPVVSAQGSASRSWDGQQGGRQGRADDWRATLSVAAPLFTGGSQRAQRAAAAAAREEARAELERLRLQLSRELQATALQLTAAQAALERYRAAVASAEAAAEAVATEFQAGTATTFQMLDAQDRLFANQLKLVQSRFAVYQTQAHLLWSSGRLTLSELAGRE